MRKRSFGQRWEVVEADVPEGLDEDDRGKVCVGSVYPGWKLDSHLLGVRDQAGDRRLSQGAQGSAQELGVQGPLGHWLGGEVEPGLRVPGVVAGEDVLEGLGGG